MAFLRRMYCTLNFIKMKTIQISIAFLLFFVLKTTAQQIKTAELQVTGLTCSMCSQATEKSLRSLDYVGNVTPDLNRNVFVVSFKQPNAVNIDDLQKKVKDAGFSIGRLQATVSFNNAKIDDNGKATVGGKLYQFVNAKNKTLNGDIRLDFIDKNFLSATAYKKRAKSLALASYATGYVGKHTRVYHVSM